MKLALIPPYAHLNTVWDSYHLLLPQCLQNVAYRTFYEQRRSAGDYIILDNGAAEGLFTPALQLHYFAQEVGASEIVIQDTMNDSRQTIKDTQNFMEYADPERFRYMGVVQGENFRDCCDVIDFYMNQEWITCVGIPRHLIQSGGARARLQLVEYIRMTCGNALTDIHLLGTSPDAILELQWYQTWFKEYNVRGVDTSAPYNYALGNRWIGDGDIIPRPKGYFNKVIPNHAPLIANINTMQRWTHD